MSATVLVVDDEPDMIELLARHLRDCGYTVRRASSGLEALQDTRRHPPDLILLDLMLEGMDGYTVCEVLRHQPATAHIPVILITALGGEIARLNGLSVGADEFVRKPFTQQDVLSRVQRLLARRAGTASPPSGRDAPAA
jgi:two-component system phosphate regulon response regulator PhoB